jgi:hypothetical protein
MRMMLFLNVNPEKKLFSEKKKFLFCSLTSLAGDYSIRDTPDRIFRIEQTENFIDKTN